MSDPGEHRASRLIYGLLGEAQHYSDTLRQLVDPQPGSVMATDSAVGGEMPIDYYAYGLLEAACGTLAALRDLLIRDETDDSYSMVAGTHGPYTLMRNSIDCAALAFWILEPDEPSLRIRRHLMAEHEELTKQVSCLKETNHPWEDKKMRVLDRISKIERDVGIEPVGTKGNLLPTTTGILREIEPANPDKTVSWLAVWQLCSGHAHGKRWAMLALHDRTQILGTSNGVGAHFIVTPSLKTTAQLLARTMALVELAVVRYCQLSRSPRTS